MADYRPEDFFDINDPKNRRILSDAGIKNVDDPDEIKFYFESFIFGNKNHNISTIKELQDCSDPSKKKLGAEFLRAMEQHPVITDGSISKEKIEENLRWYGSMFARGMDVIMNSDSVMPDQQQMGGNFEQAKKNLGDSKFMSDYLHAKMFLNYIPDLANESAAKSVDNIYGINKGEVFSEGFKTGKLQDVRKCAETICAFGAFLDDPTENAPALYKNARVNHKNLMGKPYHQLKNIFEEDLAKHKAEVSEIKGSYEEYNKWHISDVKREISKINQTKFIDKINDINVLKPNYEYKIKFEKVNEDTLYKANAVFHMIFGDLEKAEEAALREDANHDIVDNFRFGKSTPQDMLDKALKGGTKQESWKEAYFDAVISGDKDKIAGYKKLIVLYALKNEILFDREFELNYAPFLFEKGKYVTKSEEVGLSLALEKNKKEPEFYELKDKVAGKKIAEDNDWSSKYKAIKDEQEEKERREKEKERLKKQYKENKEREEKDNFRLHDWNKELKATARHTNLKEVGKAISNTGLTSFGNDSLVKMTILYAMGEKGKSLGEVIQSSDREIEEIGKQFIKEIQSKPAGGSAALEITPEQETENAKWYGNMYKKAQMKLFEEDIVFPKPNDGGSVDSLNKIRGSHFFGIAEMTDYNTNTPLSNKTSSYSKNPHKLKLATLFNEGMGEFTPEESAKRRILDSYYTLIEGATNPAQNYQERAAAKLIAECELFPVLGGVKLNEIDKEELVNFHQYLIDAKLVWNNGIIDLYDYQKAFNNLKPEECRLILDNSVDTLRKNHPDVFKKAFDGLMSMHPKAKGIQAAMENKPVERIKFVLAPEIKVEEKEEIKVENKAEIKIEEKPEIKVEEEPEIKVEEEPEINIIHDEKEDIPVRVSKNTKVEEFRTAAYKRGFKEAEDGAFLKSVLLAYKNVLEDKNISGLKKDELRDELNHLLSPNLNSDEKRNKAVDGLRKLLETDAFKNNAQCNKALSRIVERQNKVMGQDLQGPAKNVINVKPQAVKPEEKPVAPVKFDVPEEFPTKKEDLLKAFRQNGWNEKHDAAMLESMADLYFAASQRVQGKTEERINPDYIFLIEGMRTCFNKMVKQKADVRTRLELGEELQVTVTGIKVLHEFSKKAREEMEKWTNAEEKIRDAYEEKQFGDSKKEFLELADLNGWGKTNAEKQMLRNLYDCYNEADIVPEDDKQAKVCQTLTDQLRPVLNRMATKAAGDDKQKTELLASAGKACENALKDSNLFELNNLLERSIQSIYVSKKAIDAGTEKPVLKARNIENEMKKPEWKAPEPKTEIRFPQKPGDFVSKAVANGWEDEKQERRFLKNIRALYGIIESDITENKKVTNENLSNREKMIDFLNRITAAKNPDTRAREAFMDEAVELTKDMDAANVRVCVSQMKDAVKLRKTAYADERKKEEAARLERERVKAAEELRRREEENRKREEENRKREEALKVREEELKKRSERLQNKGNVLPIKTAKELFEIYTNPENQKVLDKCISISDYFGFYEGDHQELVNSWGEYFEKFSFIKERKPSDMERLRTFRDFLYTRLEDNKTFYEHIMIYCVENGYEEPVKDGIEYFNNLFGLGIDMEALENGTAPLPEKDALEEMKREEEENSEQEKRVKKILEEREKEKEKEDSEYIIDPNGGMKEKDVDLDESIIRTNSNNNIIITDIRDENDKEGGIKEEKDTPVKGGKVHHEENDLIEKIEKSVSAGKYIEEIRDKGFPIINTSHINDDVKKTYAENFLKIMAARQLVDSVRHDPTNLKKTITLKQVNERVEEMKKDSIFTGFLKDTLDDKYKMITAINGAKLRPGHGGKLDEMMKEYMLGLEPGKLKNDALHKRYLPTALARIDSIKNQVKKLNNTRSRNHEDDLKKEEMTRKAVSEIITIRNMVRADYGHKSTLEKVIPSTERDILKSTVNNVIKDEHFASICRNEDVKKLLQTGHGGKMTVKVRELEAQRIGDANETLTNILEANTIKKRLVHLRNESIKTLEKINAAAVGSPEHKQNLAVGRKLLKEFTLLAFEGYNQNGVNEDVLKNKDVPWGTVNEIRIHNTVPDMMMEVAGRIDMLNATQVKQCLENMKSPNVNEFINDLKNKLNAKVAGGAAPNANAAQPNPRMGGKGI